MTNKNAITKTLILTALCVWCFNKPAQAQSSRSSSTNSAAGIRVTPTAVPSARAKTWNEVTYNTCVAPIFESMSRGVPYTGVCEREYVNGKYVCRHFARDNCKEIAARGISDAIRTIRKNRAAIALFNEHYVNWLMTSGEAFINQPSSQLPQSA